MTELPHPSDGAFERPFERLATHPIRRALLATRGTSDCLLVGGVLRDLLVFGEIGHDWDLVVSEAPSFARRLAEHTDGRRVRLGGDRYRLFRVVTTGEQVDLQEPLEKGLEAELRRRDLPVNAIALDLVTGRLHAPLGGRADARRAVLRAVSPRAFTADPLRVLRLLRFATTLPGFTIEDGTAELARRSAPGLDGIAVERAREELHRALSVQRVPRLGSLLAALGLLPGPWAPPDTLAPERGAVRALDRLDESLERVAALAATQIPAPDLEAARHAAVLIVLGGAPEAAAALTERGLVSRRLGREIERLVSPAPAPRDEAETRRFLHAWKHSWPVAAGVRLWRARGSARHRWSDALPRLAETAARAGDRIFDPPPLLTGDELRAETGLPAGPEVGRLLAALRDAQITGEISTPREAREWLRRRPPGS